MFCMKDPDAEDDDMDPQDWMMMPDDVYIWNDFLSSRLATPEPSRKYQEAFRIVCLILVSINNSVKKQTSDFIYYNTLNRTILSI